jgi:transposase
MDSPPILRSQSSTKKRKQGSSEIIDMLKLEFFQTPMKKVKKNTANTSGPPQNNTSQSYHPLNNTERSLAYLQSQLGASPHEIALNLSRNSSTIKNFLDNAATSKSFAPRHSSKGRWTKGSTKLTERHKNLLQKWLQDRTMHSARQCWIRINKVKTLPSISYHPVNNYLKTIGSFVRPKLKSVVSPANRIKRLEYCNEYKDFNFGKVMFTDESSFQLNSNNLRAFRFRGQAPPRVTKFNPNYKVMVWAGISCFGKTSLHFVQGKLNQVKYTEMLSNHREEMVKIFRRRGNWFFQQDNAPCHKPVRVKDFIREYLTADILLHPPQSPDLNPIELIWAFMKTKVEADRPRNTQQLRDSIKRAWKQVTLAQIRKVIDGLPDKMQKIIDCNGDIL